MSLIGCTKEPLVSIPACPQKANEGIIYYLPKNIYRLDVDARLTQCGNYTDTRIIDDPKIDLTTKINVRIVADENAAYTARPQTFGDWNDDFTTHFTRSSNGLLLSVNTTNDDKSAEVASGYIAAAASVALAIQTGGLSLALPNKKTSAIPQSICKEEYLLALTNYEKNKKDFKEKAEKIAQLSEIIADLEKNIANTERAKEKGLKQLLDERYENDKKLTKLNKEIASNHEAMSKLDKQLTFTTSVRLFGSNEQQKKYQQSIDLSNMIDHMFTKEFLETRFVDQTGEQILQKSISMKARMTDADGKPLAPNYAKPKSLETGWRYNNDKDSGFRGIVYRDKKDAYLEIVNKQNEIEHILYRDLVPFFQGGMIGVAPLYNWDGKGSSSVKFDENGSLIEYKAEITESSGEKSSNAAKAIGSTVQDYSEKNMELEKIQLQHELDLLKLKKEIKDVQDQLNETH